MAATYHELVHHLLHKLQTPLRTLWLPSGIALVRAVVVKLVVVALIYQIC
jgi:hypothetical protein